MNKPGSLRAYLVAALPELQRDPDRLLVFIDSGSVVATGAPGRSFEYRYTLRLIVTDYAGHPDALMLPLLDWIRVHQWELLDNPKNRERIAFEAELLAGDKVDLEIALPLTEAVVVQRDADGAVQLQHMPEPPVEQDPFPVPSGGRWQFSADGEVVADWPAAGG